MRLPYIYQVNIQNMKTFKQYILENKNYHGIIFRQEGKNDVGCCVGVEHGKFISLPTETIQRIKKIPNLKFYAEGSAAKNPSDEPYMLPFIKKHFPEVKLEKKSWDDIAEENDKGTANNKYNIIYTFMQHRYNKIIDWYSYTDGTMLEAMARTSKKFPKNSPFSYRERLGWLTHHMKKAGFYDRLDKPYDRKKFLKIMDDMEYSVYKDRQYPDTSTYFGKLAQLLEQERNQVIYDLMENGGCCFAGSGHIVELSKQFKDLKIDFLNSPSR